MKILAIETSCDETAIALCERDNFEIRNSTQSYDPSHTTGQGGSPHRMIGAKFEISQNFSFKILAEAVASQIKIHRPYGGVVPALAKREHIKNLPVLWKKIALAVKRPRNDGRIAAVVPIASFRWLSGLPRNDERFVIASPERAKQSSHDGILSKIDLIAVTVGPGLEPALWTGINFANDLAKKMNVPIVGINHLEGHIFSNWIPVRKEIRNSKFEIRNSTNKTIEFPSIVLLVSGGHTILLLMKNIKKWSPSRKASADQWSKLGETRDDAVGEAFDKVAKMLGLPYPGGPEIEKLANQYRLSRRDRFAPPPRGGGARDDDEAFRGNLIPFPRPMINSKNYDFSFSGLKTAVLYYLRDNSLQPTTYNLQANIAASFQQAAIDVLVKKTTRAAKEFGAKSILLCGGVACNKALQGALELGIRNYELWDEKPVLFVPPVKYNTDNAVMIAAAACLGNHYPADRALPNLNL